MAQFIPPLTWLRSFESAARHLSFTKAAAELNLTQSGVSQHVKSLEVKFGCDLFVRGHKSLQLTDQGRRLLPKISSAITGLAEISSAFDQGSESETLLVVASPSVARTLIIPALPSFVASHPDINIQLSTRTWPDEFSAVNADVEIRFDTAQSSRRGGELLGSQKMQIVGAPRFLEQADVPLKSPSACYALPRIQVIGTADTWESFATPAKTAENLHAMFQVEAHGLAVDMAVEGLGLAYVNSLVAERAVTAGRLSVLFQNESPPKDGYYLFVNQRAKSEAVEDFRRWLKSQVQKP